MSRCVDLDEKVTAQFYDQECEEWTMQTVTIEDVLDSVCDEYTVLPSAQTERKQGKWIYGEDEYGIDGYHCDKCGFFVPWDYAHNFINYIEDYNFCPNCGADMREASND